MVGPLLSFGFKQKQLYYMQSEIDSFLKCQEDFLSIKGLDESELVWLAANLDIIILLI